MLNTAYVALHSVFFSCPICHKSQVLFSVVGGWGPWTPCSTSDCSFGNNKRTKLCVEDLTNLEVSRSLCLAKFPTAVFHEKSRCVSDGESSAPICEASVISPFGLSASICLSPKLVSCGALGVNAMQKLVRGPGTGPAQFTRRQSARAMPFWIGTSGRQRLVKSSPTL